MKDARFMLFYRDTELNNITATRCRCIPAMVLFLVASAPGVTSNAGQRELLGIDDEQSNVETDTSEQQSSVNECIATDSMSRQWRSDLIHRLEVAEALDDRNEQEMLNNLWTDQAPNTQEFDHQKELVRSLVRALKRGATVCWSNVEHALSVPVPPY